MDALFQDVRQALRVLLKSPLFAATAVIAIALGIGANTAIFSVVNAVILKPLPFTDAGRLVLIGHSFKGAPTPWISSAPTNFVHWRAQDDVLMDVAAWRHVSLDYTAADTVQSVTATAVSEAYFRALGASFALGRGFSSDEDAPNAGKFAVLSHRFWARRLDGDPEVVGKTISLNGVATTVVGVAAKDFDVRDLNVRDSSRPDVWVPLQIGSNTVDTMHSLDVIGRLRPGIPLQTARQRLAASMRTYAERFPQDAQQDEWSFTAFGLRAAIVGESRPTLFLLSGAVGLVLLIACANVANLLLVRALGRNREFAIRVALGAGRWRVARQLLVESVLLALVGGAFGVVAGVLGMRWFLSIGPADLPRLDAAGALVDVDWRVLTFALGASVLTALSFGLVPALVSTRTDLSAIMDSASSRSSGDRGRMRLQSLLVATEVGLSVVLVIGAALLIRTSFALGALDLGLSVDNVLTMRTSLSEPRFQTATGLAQVSNSLLTRVRSIPGVEVTAVAFGQPLLDNMVLPFDIVGRENAGPSTGVVAAVPSSFEYFDALKIQLLAGRRFDERDVRGAPAVVVINREMADKYWADGHDPLTARIRIASSVMPEAADEPEREVVGIVGNVRQRGSMGDPEPTMYFPLSQVSDGLTRAMNENAPMSWIVRMASDPRAVAAVIQKAVREETGQRVLDIRLMKDTWERSTSRQRLNMWLLVVFGGAALLLGTVGVYGLMAYSAQQRRKEIGIRIALGAKPGTVGRMVIMEGMLVVLVGLGAGVVASYLLANVLASFLFGVEPHDVVVFAVVPLVLAIVALTAVAVPAVRASRVDPTEALRHS